MPNQTDQPDEPTRSGGVRGKFVVGATLSLFIIVPAIAIFIAPMLTGGSKTLDLDYDHRHTWFMQPVKARPLEYDKFVAGETGRKYRRTDLQIEPEVEQALQRCMQLAQDDKFYTNQDAPEQLLPLAEEARFGFYPAYLLAVWHQANDNPAQFDVWIRVAFSRAQGALAQRFIDEDSQPLAGHRLPAPVAIGYDRVIEGQRNANLVLVYPAPVSDDRGYVYLPTYRSIYRLTDPQLPLGVDPGIHPIKLTFLPQPPQGEQPNWFAVPDGAVGLFKETVVPATQP